MLFILIIHNYIFPLQNSNNFFFMGLSLSDLKKTISRLYQHYIILKNALYFFSNRFYLEQKRLRLVLHFQILTLYDVKSEKEIKKKLSLKLNISQFQMNFCGTVEMIEKRLSFVYCYKNSRNAFNCYFLTANILFQLLSINIGNLVQGFNYLPIKINILITL